MLGAIRSRSPSEDNHTEVEDSKQSTWLSLPQKTQLGLIFAARLSDFIHLAAIQSYVLDQLKSFDNSLSDSNAAKQLGILNAGFTASQAITSILWGRVSDVPWIGRKPVLMSGLLGTALSCVGLAFSQSFSQALASRIFGGAVNANGGICITMIAESIESKRHLPRAFLLLPLSFIVGALIGPVLGAYLSNPGAGKSHLPKLGTASGGRSGGSLIQSVAYAPPALTCAGLLLGCAILGSLLLKETVPGHNWNVMRMKLSRIINGSNNGSQSPQYSKISYMDEEELLNSRSTMFQDHFATEPEWDSEKLISDGKSHWNRSNTRRVMSSLLTQAIFDFHMGAFGCVWILFLCAPEELSQGNTPRRLQGGLQMSARQAGLATSIIGLVGVPLQLLFYPRIQERLGTIMSYKIYSGLFPISYALIPFIPFTQSNSNGNGMLTWFCITFVLILHTTGRVVAIPATISLVNDSSPHPSLRGVVNGLGQSVTGTFRTLGPIIGAYAFAYGLENQLVGILWWSLAGVALTGTLLI